MVQNGARSLSKLYRFTAAVCYGDAIVNESHVARPTSQRVHLRSDVFMRIRLLLRKRLLQQRLQSLQMVWLLRLLTRLKRIQKVVCLQLCDLMITRVITSFTIMRLDDHKSNYFFYNYAT
jgi:hypothetical protein